jgi:hypothetical protein
MTERKTTRKNNTDQTIVWPSNDQYFTIRSLVDMNPHMLTQSKSDITLRVRLKKAIDQDGTVEEIGYKNNGKGRPTKAFTMKPATKEAIAKAIADGITIEAPAAPVPVVQVSPSQSPSQVATPNVFGKPVVV